MWRVAPSSPNPSPPPFFFSVRNSKKQNKKIHYNVFSVINQVYIFFKVGAIDLPIFFLSNELLGMNLLTYCNYVFLVAMKIKKSDLMSDASSHHKFGFLWQVLD